MPSNLSNPFSTGGGGTNFEVKVLSSFLVTMICDVACPCFPENQIESIRMQSKEAGFDTDDILVETINPEGKQQKLLGQIKHQLSFTESNKEFKEVLQSAWNDFSNPDLFIKENDQIVIITGPLSKKAINDVRRVLEFARHCAASEEFHNKIESEGFSSKGKRSFVTTVTKLLNEFVGLELNKEIIWNFLSSLHLLNYDFDVGDSHDEIRILQLIELCKAPDSSETNAALWAQLLMLTGEYNQNAGTIPRKDLEKILPNLVGKSLLRQTAIRSSESIRKLLEHSAFTLDIIKTEVGKGISIPRDSVVEQALTALENNQLILLSGEAGGGKSALAKKILERQKEDGPVFAFRVEEFDQPNLHQALFNIGINDSFSDLSASFGLMPKRILFVDSVERIFEMSYQEAFIQLLSYVSKDNNWTIILSCREHAQNLFATQVLGAIGLNPHIIRIPLLTDQEINFVADQVPLIKKNLVNKKLLKVLRNPFFLSIACQNLPNDLDGQSVIKSEDIRKILWREAISRLSKSKPDLAARREKEFLLIAVQRAKLLQPYIRFNSNDQEALGALISDNVVDELEDGRIAPAHDLFEDFAVEEFINRCFHDSGYIHKQFFEKIGSEPAIRRAFRHWLTITLTSENKNISDLVINAVCDEVLPQFWRDETLVSLLLSEETNTILQRLKSDLLANNQAILIRIIHLLRTACKEPNYSFFEEMGIHKGAMFEAMFHVLRPVGKGWTSVINIIKENLDQFGIENAEIIHGLLEGWVKSLDLDTPITTEITNCSIIAFGFYNILQAEERYTGDLEDKFLDIITRIPQGQPKEVISLYDNALKSEGHLRMKLVENAVCSIDSGYLCKHLPEVVFKSIKSLTEPRIIDHRSKGLMIGDDDLSYGIQGYFGLGRTSGFKTHPPSVFQGPFSQLFRFHPEMTLDFVIEFINITAVKYSNSRLSEDDFAFTVDLKVNDKIENELYCSERLWCLYRATIPGPDFLVSLLMAFENWLLQTAKEKKDITSAAKKIIEKSNSVAPLAVLVSVTTAYPEVFSDSLIPIISNIHFYKLDRRRMVHERESSIDIRGLFGIPKGGMDDLYYDERDKSNKLKHRKEDLSNLVVKLQFTDFRPRVTKCIDNMLDVYVNPQDEDTRKLDRLLFKQIDIRQWDVQGESDEGVLVGPRIEDPDLIEFKEESDAEIEEANRWAKLRNWSQALLEHSDNDDYETWREALNEAIELSQSTVNSRARELFNLNNTVAYAASAVIIGHIDELSDTEIHWCSEVVFNAVTQNAYTNDTFEWVQQQSYHGSRTSAIALSVLYKKWIFEPEKLQKVKEYLAVAITHSVNEVAYFAILGVKQNLWSVDKRFAKRCFDILLWRAMESGKLNSQRRSEEINYPIKYVECLIEAKETLLIENKLISIPSEIKLDSLDSNNLLMALSIVPEQNIEESFVDLLSSTLSDLVQAFYLKAQDKSYHSINQDIGISSNYQFHSSFYRIYANVMFNCKEKDLSKLLRPILESIDKVPKQAGDLIQTIIYAADRQESFSRFWELWNPITEMVFDRSTASWENRELIKTVLFGNTYWKEDSKEWQPIVENKEYIYHAFSKVGHTNSGFYALSRLLTNVGAFLLPGVIIELNDGRLRAETDLLKDENTVKDLEIIFRNIVLRYNSKIRSREKLRIACIQLLDELINRGSSAAFLLRELLISPLPNKN